MGAHNDVLDSIRTRHSYRGDNLYGWLTFDKEGQPYAVQFSVSGKVINMDPITLSNIDALARMTTLALREFDLDHVIEGLLRCSRVKNDLAAIIADILITHGGDNVFKTEQHADRTGECEGEQIKGAIAPETCG